VTIIECSLVAGISTMFYESLSFRLHLAESVRSTWA